MEAPEALRRVTEQVEAMVSDAVGTRPPEVAGVAEVGPVGRLAAQVCLRVADELEGVSSESSIFEEEAQAASFVIRDVRRFGSLVNGVISRAVTEVRATASSTGPQFHDAVRDWTIEGIGQAVSRYLADRVSQAGIDGLTGLERREPFEAELARLARKQGAFSLLLADLDDLKKYNTVGGYVEGNRQISRMAQCLKDALADKGKVFRWGGDEFVALLPEMEPADAAALIKEIRQAEDPPFSYGLAHFPDEAVDPNQLWATAEDRSKVDKGLRKVEREVAQSPSAAEPEGAGPDSITDE